MPRTRHPKKTVEEALRYAEQHGWRVEIGGSHAWGKIIVQIMTKIAGVGSSVLQVSGVRRLIHQIMVNKFDEWSITVLQVR